VLAFAAVESTIRNPWAVVSVASRRGSDSRWPQNQALLRQATWRSRTASKQHSAERRPSATERGTTDVLGARGPILER